MRYHTSPCCHGAWSGHRGAGFTLIELLVVLACIGILAALAYPSYADSIRRAARAEAQAQLMEIAQTLERRYANRHHYAAADGAFSGPDALAMTQSPGTGVARYLITGAAIEGGQGYWVQARPQGPQSADPCGTLGIRHTGAKTPMQGTDGRACW
jgi:type IV pilus assembly protein PilE